jgi:hypothetical protein
MADTEPKAAVDSVSAERQPAIAGVTAEVVAVNSASLRTAKWWVAERRTLADRRLDRLGRYLAQPRKLRVAPGR